MEQGVPQALALFVALALSKRALESLTLHDVAYGLLVAQLPIYADGKVAKIVAGVMAPLKRFRLGIAPCRLATTELIPDAQDVAQMQDEFSDAIHQGLLHQMVSAAPELRELRLRFPYTQQKVTLAELGQVFRQTVWPKLNILGISHKYGQSDNYLDLLLRHKETLREVPIYHAELTEGTWEDLFTDLAGELPKLKKTRLRGRLLLEGEHEEFNFPNGVCSPKRDAIEKFILKGGQWPDVSWRPDHVGWHYMSMRPKYVEPGSEDEDDASDDSYRLSEADDFDSPAF